MKITNNNNLPQENKNNNNNWEEASTLPPKRRDFETVLTNVSLSTTRVIKSIEKLDPNKSEGNTKAGNNIVYKGLMAPKINHSRNNRRFNLSLNALLLYFDTCLFPDEPIIKSVLTDLAFRLQNLYQEDPSSFCSFVKRLANWTKVNSFALERKSGLIQLNEWDKRTSCPTILIELFALLSSTPSFENQTKIIRSVLSLFELVNTVTVPSEPSLNTITDPFSGEEKYLEKFDIDNCLLQLGLKIDDIRDNLADEVRNLEWHVSSSSGPNGQALWMSHIDAKAVKYDKTLTKSLLKLSLELNLDVMDKLDDSFHLPNFFKQSNAFPEHSKLHFIFEKGNKCRTIAIIDYWTQQILIPIHNTIQNINKTLENDGTFDQDKLVHWVSRMTSLNSSQLYSLDLTAATDRLPIDLQVLILEKLFGNRELALAWKDVLVSRSYKLITGEKIKYTVGQPMGAKSSFPMLALTHHVIVQQAAINAGKTGFNDYIILGDDIVINNTAVAKSYKELMKALGMEISEHKSIVSDESTSRVRSAEIARRLFVSGIDVSPFPMKLLATVLENNDMVDQLQEELYKRNLYNSRKDLLIFFSGILNKTALSNIIMYNGLPSAMTGMKSCEPFPGYPNYDSRNFKELYGYTEENLVEYYNYIVITEQLKRANTILANTRSVYDTIIKAASVSKTIGIGMPEKGYMPIEDFDSDEFDDWELVRTFHPATEAVKKEIERINRVLMQMTSAESSPKKLLLSKLVDSLKISSYETNPDKAFTESKITRKLIQSTLRALDASHKRDNKLLSYSVKLERLNILWYVKVSLFAPCTVSRTFSKIPTFAQEAKQRSDVLHKELSNNSPFNF
nr:MAG: putative RNA dependent RNA polymerase [Guangxi mito-like virus 15]